MPNDVIDRVRNLARQAHANLGLDSTESHGHPPMHEDDEDANDSEDESYQPDDEGEEEDDDDEPYIADDDANDFPIPGVNDQNDNNDDNDQNNNGC